MRSTNETQYPPFLALAVLIGMAVPAAAMQCGPKVQIEKVLTEKFKEKLHSAGIAGTATAGAVFSLYLSDSGSWTITRRTTQHPNALCVMASGKDWSKAKAKPKGVSH